MDYNLESLKSFFTEYKSESVNKHSFFSVLIPLVEHDGDLFVLLEKRAAHISQPGEICFPGGHIEAGEPPQAAARRECSEELGIGEQEIEILAQGDTLYGQADFTLYSYIGKISYETYSNIKKESGEVEAVYLFPLSHFIENEAEIFEEEYCTNMKNFPYEKVGIPFDYKWRRGTMQIPIYEINGIVIWGMTAQLLRKLSEKIRKALK